jgi:hypothetical protein
MTRPGVRLRTGVESDAEAVSQVLFEAVRRTAAASYPPEVVERWAPDPERDTATYLPGIGGDPQLQMAGR